MEGFILACRLLKGRVLSKGAKNKLLFKTFNKFWAKNSVDYASWSDVVKNTFGGYSFR